jgi:hypothetical protein
MNTRATLLPLLALALAVQAQRSKDTPSLQWNGRIDVLSGELRNGKHTLPADRITLYECDARTALELFRTDAAPTARSISGKEPLKAQGLRVDGVEGEVMLLATARDDKKSRSAQLTVAIAVNDSTVVEDHAARQAHLRALAVRLNRAVVQRQIDRYTAELAKTTGELGSTQKDKAKAQQDLAKTNRDLDRIKAGKAKLQRENATLHGDITGLEKKFALSQNPKDLDRLTKARKKLASNEASLSKLMAREAKVQQNATKHQGSVDEYGGKEQAHQGSREELQRIINELQRKQDSIR